MKCDNCGATHGCNCQLKIASDGTRCCTACIQSYEISKGASSNTGQPSPNNFAGTAPVINSIVYNNLNN